MWRWYNRMREEGVDMISNLKLKAGDRIVVQYPHGREIKTVTKITDTGNIRVDECNYFNPRTGNNICKYSNSWIVKEFDGNYEKI